MRGTVSKYTTGAGGRWRISYDLAPDPVTGMRRQTTRRGFTRKRDAQRALRAALGSIEDNTYIEPSRMTVAEYLREWLDGWRVRPTTADRYRRSAEHHVIPRIGGIRIQQLTADTLDALYRDLEREGGPNGGPLAPKTVRNAHGMIHKALAVAAERGYVVRNVADHARPPQGSRPEMKVWEAGQLRTYLDHVRQDRLYALWLLFTTTGMRRGEVLGLRPEDLDGGRLTIRRQVTILDGKAHVAESTKTNKGRRTIALDPATVTALQAHLIQRYEELTAAGVDPEQVDYVFCWEDGSMIYPGLVSKWFRAHAKAALLPRIRLHDLRHSYATAALRAGVPPKVVSDRLVHSTVSFTLDTYTHVLPSHDADAAATIATAILGE
jgi:integrase